MNSFINAIASSANKFVKDEDGAQVIEYALIIAVVSIALVLGLSNLEGQFGTFIGRVGTCLTTANCV